jgi:hypothetical protein
MPKGCAAALLVAACFLAVLARPGVARADSPAAQALFDDAVTLRDAGKLAEACAKFDESLRLEATVGTRFNLADCQERIGLFASAWSNFLHVAADTERSGEAARAQAARDRAGKIAPRLSRMTIRPAARHDGLLIRRNGAVIGAPQWSSAVPVDPGSYTIEASAPGKQTWRQQVVVEGEGTLLNVNVPALADAPIALPPSAGSPQPPISDDGDGGGVSLGMTLGLTFGITGLVGVGLGVGFGLAAIDDKNEVDELCPNLDACTEEGIALNDEAKTSATVSTVGFVAGGVLLAAGIVLWVALPSDDEASALRLRLGPGAAALEGRF